MEILVDRLHLVDKDNVLNINLILLFSENILIMTINNLYKYLHYGYYNTKKEKINIYEKNSKGR